MGMQLSRRGVARHDMARHGTARNACGALADAALLIGVRRQGGTHGQPRHRDTTDHMGVP